MVADAHSVCWGCSLNFLFPQFKLYYIEIFFFLLSFHSSPFLLRGNKVPIFYKGHHRRFLVYKCRRERGNDTLSFVFNFLPFDCSSCWLSVFSKTCTSIDPFCLESPCCQTRHENGNVFLSSSISLLHSLLSALLFSLCLKLNQMEMTASLTDGREELRKMTGEGYATDVEIVTPLLSAGHFDWFPLSQLWLWEF